MSRGNVYIDHILQGRVGVSYRHANIATLRYHRRGEAVLRMRRDFERAWSKDHRGHVYPRCAQRRRRSGH